MMAGGTYLIDSDVFVTAMNLHYSFGNYIRECQKTSEIEVWFRIWVS